jgi:hypothetical protein
MRSRINGPMLDLGTGRILPEEVVAFPVLRRPDWSGNEATPAVRAHVLQDSIDTGGAEGAFVGTDARFERVWRQRPVAVLAGRPEFKHTGSFVVTANDYVQGPRRWGEAQRSPAGKRSPGTCGWACPSRAALSAATRRLGVCVHAEARFVITRRRCCTVYVTTGCTSRGVDRDLSDRRTLCTTQVSAAL